MSTSTFIRDHISLELNNIIPIFIATSNIRMFYSSAKICCLFAAILLLFKPVQSKSKSKALGKYFDDDDVRTAIQIACDTKDKDHHGGYSVVNHYCNLAFAPYLLTDSYRQLQSPSKCCDKECTLPVALSCYATISSCIEHCNESFVSHVSHRCKECIHEMRASAQCCPCVAYFVGIVHKRGTAKKICDHCPQLEETCEEECQECEECTGGNCPHEKEHFDHHRHHGRGHEKNSKSDDDEM